MVDVPYDAIADVPPAEVGEVELYHPKSWWTQYVFSQDAKVIAIQYSLTASAIGLVALVLSWIYELTPQTVSLEEAFMALTGDSVEYHGSTTAGAHPGAQPGTTHATSVRSAA